MNVKGQWVEKPVCLQLSARCTYFGEVCQAGGSQLRQGLGVQVLLEEDADGGLQLVSRYEGDWENDQMHGSGRLDMQAEAYEGEFYRGEPNGSLASAGQGCYTFRNGDFYSGSFLDGHMDGEGTYFSKTGEAVDGIFHKSRLVVDGIPVPPYLCEKDRSLLLAKLNEGRADPVPGIELPAPAFISSADGLVEAVLEAVRLRRLCLVVRSTSFAGDLETILGVLDRKKARFLFYSTEDLLERTGKTEFLLGLKEAMETGTLLALDVDFKLRSRPGFTVSAELSECVPLKVLNRDSQAILGEFAVAGIEPPQLIHPDFLLLLFGAVRADATRGDCAEQLASKYRWMHELSRLAVLVVQEFKKPSPLYQTELVEESVNFENAGGQGLVE